MEISHGAIINCSHESCVNVVNKTNLQSKPFYSHTQTRDNTLSDAIKTELLIVTVAITAFL
jgi:hypothetical protein